jgi:hypothetical protein
MNGDQVWRIILLSWFYNYTSMCLVHCNKTEILQTWCAPFIPVTHGEYCDFENFDAQCSSGMQLHVIKALYGHIAVGECITRDTNLLGCQSDLTQLVGQKCDGKAGCSLDVDGSELLRANPCDRGLSVYLDVLHACVRGKTSQHILWGNSFPSTFSPLSLYCWDNSRPTAHY